jgi:putative tryptophan/tyrosine transport system substrate-binding protein
VIRREFIVLVGSVTAWPLVALTQERGRNYHLGSLYQAPWDAPHHVAFREELTRLGFVEGGNLVIDRTGHGMRPEQFAQHAEHLVKSKVDVIQCGGDAAIRAAQQATSAIPILGLTDDMVGAGLVASLAHPGGNITGVSILASELDAKRQETLLELVPTAREIAVLADSVTTAPSQLRALERAGAAHGVKVMVYEIRRVEEIAPAIDAAKGAGAAALNVLATPLFFNNREIIFERTTAVRLPAIYQWPEIANDGGLVAYGPSIVKIYRRQLAPMLAKLLRGTTPANLPVEQPAEFDLVINQRTAKALGLAISASLLARADEVIE